MLLQDSPESQRRSISPVYALWLIILYWVLNLIGQTLSLMPQMMVGLFGSNEALMQGSPDDLMKQILTDLYYPWYINLFHGLAFVLILWLYKREGVRFFLKTHLTKKELFEFVLYAVVFVAVSTALEAVITNLQPNFNTANQQMLESIFVKSSPVTMFISIVLLAPITEEVMFRGAFTVMFKRFKLAGFLVCAVIFTLFHGPKDLLSFLIYFIMALGLGGIYWKTKRIEASIFAHMLNNLVGFLLMLG